MFLMIYFFVKWNTSCVCSAIPLFFWELEFFIWQYLLFMKLHCPSQSDQSSLYNMSQNIIGPDKDSLCPLNCINFLTHQFKHVFWVLKRTVSLRRFFWVPTTYVWWRNKKNNFPVHTLIWWSEIFWKFLVYFGK